MFELGPTPLTHLERVSRQGDFPRVTVTRVGVRSPVGNRLPHGSRTYTPSLQKRREERTGPKSTFLQVYTLTLFRLATNKYSLLTRRESTGYRKGRSRGFPGRESTLYPGPAVNRTRGRTSRRRSGSVTGTLSKMSRDGCGRRNEEGHRQERDR